MRLTKKKAIEISIELWEWLAETGARDKWEWAGWKKYGEMENECALCEYSKRQWGGQLLRFCDPCPLDELCEEDTICSIPYENWEGTRSPALCKKYATEFLEVLKGLQ